MPFYLRWSDSSGNINSNNELLQISGITGNLVSIQYTLREDIPAHTLNRYIFDIRRTLDSTSNGGDAGWFFQGTSGSGFTSNVSNLQINGSPASANDFFAASADDVCRFEVNRPPSQGVVSFGARFNEIEHLYGLAVSEIVIVDDEGTHTLSMSDSGGTGTVVTSDTGNITATLFNFPTDNSQWVFYSDGGAISATVTELSQSFGESSSISISATLTAAVTESNFDFTESSIATITNNLISISVTEASQNFSESSSVDVSSLLSVAVTESSQYFAESSITDISANISALVTEFAQDFDDSISINLTGSFTAEVTESAIDFDEACYIQLPVQRLVPRKTISVSNRSGSTIRVRRRSSTIRVK